MPAPFSFSYHSWWLGSNAQDVDGFLDQEFDASSNALRWILSFGAAFFLFRGSLEMALIPTPSWTQDLIFRLVGFAYFAGLVVAHTKVKKRLYRAIILCVYLSTYVSAAVIWSIDHHIHVGFLAVPMVLCLTIGILLWPFFRGLIWPALSVLLPAIAFLHLSDAMTRDWMGYGLSLSVATMFAVVMRRARLQTSYYLYTCEKELRQQVDRDALTGLLNLSGWRAKTQTLLAQDQRVHPLCVVYFDLDHFKNINDQNGHAVGDQVLIKAAKIMASQLRQDDVLARIGGEEFVLALPKTPRDQAEKIANRIRLMIAKIDDPVPVTISAGVAQMMPGSNLGQVMDLADQGLLEAKRQGRNRVQFAAG